MACTQPATAPPGHLSALFGLQLSPPGLPVMTKAFRQLERKRCSRIERIPELRFCLFTADL